MFLQVDDVMTYAGQKLWTFLLSAPHYIQVSDELKEIFAVQALDSFRALVDCSADALREKMQDYMRLKLHKLISRKFKDDETKCNQELEKFYGPYFAYSPEDYELVAGHVSIINAVVNAVRSSQKGTCFEKRHQSFNNQSHSKKRSKADPTDTDTILEQRERLLNNICSWKDKESEWMDAADFIDPTESGNLSITVGNDGCNFYAKVGCLHASCEKVTTIHKNKTRWNTTNYFRHVSIHKPSIPKADQQTVYKIFKQMNKEKETNQASPSGSQENGTESRHSESQEKGTDGQESDQSSNSNAGDTTNKSASADSQNF